MSSGSLLVLIVIVLSRMVAFAGPQAGQSTILEGVYTVEQARRGEVHYQEKCVQCHGADMFFGSVSPLRGDGFIERWREDSLHSLFAFTKGTMPKSGPKFTDDKIYLDLVALILSANMYPAGEAELTVERLPHIMFVGKDGPKPVPNNSLVLLVGCMTGSGESWSLANASEPVRNRTGDQTTVQELEISKQRPLGTQTLSLRNLDLLENFDPERHKGHKLQAKGVLFREPNNFRLYVTSLESVDSHCAP